MTGDDRPALADRRDLAEVYQPAEDSHLLATTAAGYADAGQRALDVGTGSGYVAAALAEAGADVVGTDRNPAACRQAREAGVPVVRANLADPFVADAFDLVTFNPPYLPTPDEEGFDDRMEQALSGGPDGRRVIEPFLETVDRVLAPGGVVLLLVSTLTDVDAVRELAGAAGFGSEQVASESYPFEQLVVLALC